MLIGRILYMARCRKGYCSRGRGGGRDNYQLSLAYIHTYLEVYLSLPLQLRSVPPHSSLIPLGELEALLHSF
jgi:hypothetical protein